LRCDGIINSGLVVDCTGLCGGDAYYDNCVVCVAAGDMSCDQGCDGIWYNDGLAPIFDDCFVCGGDNTYCADCAGTPNGNSYEDECGVCDSDNSNDCEQDCAGNWGGIAMEEYFYYDADNDGLGSGEGSIYCNDWVPSGMVNNDNDIDDACYSNAYDCLGICDGMAVINSCGICNADESDCETQVVYSNQSNIAAGNNYSMALTAAILD
jgi:hypothetical protein